MWQKIEQKLNKVIYICLCVIILVGCGAAEDKALEETEQQSNPVVSQTMEVPSSKPSVSEDFEVVESLGVAEDIEIQQEQEVALESAEDAVVNMRLGWNLGNTLDSYGSWINPDSPTNYETAWGNPQTTRELVQAVKDAGFHTIRVPVTWYEHMDENGKVDEAWMARVKEVVDYVIELDMYCILNVHHDCGGGETAWLRADQNRYDSTMAERYAYLWEQIATEFEEYDQYLLFEGFNELLDEDLNWGGSDAESYQVVNRLNQLFVDTVRATGGNNANRNLICCTYGASSAQSQVDGFVAPEDSVVGHLIAEVHIYDPDDFVSQRTVTWTSDHEQALDTIFERLNEKIIEAQGLPMIVGEFGTHKKYNTDEADAERAKYAEYFVSKAKEYGITCIWWDDGGEMKLFNRSKKELVEEGVVQAMIGIPE